jgi:hypothetical protein
MRAVPARGEVEVVMPTIGGNEREVSHGVPGKSEPGLQPIALTAHAHHGKGSTTARACIGELAGYGPVRQRTAASLTLHLCALQHYRIWVVDTN